ncbi:hypothetical protein KKG36_00570 [Patescibacteria group bacterium]|nr:hypothetical protein [Patescibacteria group bacterium]
MNKILHSLLIIILVVLALAGGFVGGVYFTKQQYLKSLLNSSVIASIFAYGEVVNISGNVITLRYNGEELKIPIKDGALIYAYVADDSGEFIQQEVGLGQIKRGDRLNVDISVLPAGDLQGESITILPPAGVR